MGALPAGIFAGTHLWFLYYLTMITVAVLAIRTLVRSGSPWHARLARWADAAFARLAASRLSLPVFVVPTAALLWFMNGWGMDTPDQTLRPHVPVLLLYGGCFVLGWMLQRNPERLEQFARLTPWRWILAGIGCGATLLLSAIQFNTSHPHFTAARAAHVVSYAVMMWSFVFLSVGVFRRLCSRPNAVVRYVADSSYWMYLIHLPVVVWLQVAVARLPLHWAIKLPAISMTAVAVALITYDLLVRSTVVGQVLNGRRRTRLFFAGGPRTSPAVPE